MRGTSAGATVGAMYEVLPHTADVGIAAEGRGLEEVFGEAARGMAAIILDAEPPPPGGAVPVEVSADDPEALLVAFLEECLYLFETRGELVVGARLAIGANTARGEVLIAPGLEPAGPAIKAVTYHGLRLEKRDAGTWRAEVYFDV